MLSLFLNVKNRRPHGPAPPENTGEQAGQQPAAPQEETVPDPGAHVPAGDIFGLLSIIIANGEFLEVVYGENRHLKNILDAANQVKRTLRDT